MSFVELTGGVQRELDGFTVSFMCGTIEIFVRELLEVVELPPASGAFLELGDGLTDVDCGSVSARC